MNLLGRVRAGTSLTSLGAALLVAALVVTGCSTGPPPISGKVTVSAGQPEPVGAAVASTPPSTSHSAPPAQNCDRMASLRPTSSPQGPALQRITARGRLIAGVDQNTYLFGFRDSSSGEIVGFDIDVVRRIAQAMFGDAGRVQFKVLNSADRIPALQHGDVDLVVRTMTINCERLQQVSFSSVYYLAGQRILARRDSGIGGVGDLAGKKVCATKGSTSVDNIVSSSPSAVPVTVGDWTDCLVMLQQGQVDAVSTDDAILAGLAAQDPYAQVVGPRFSEEPYGVAMPKNADDLVRFVNGVLERMRSDGTWAANYQHWLSDRLGPASPPKAAYQD